MRTRAGIRWLALIVLAGSLLLVSCSRTAEPESAKLTNLSQSRKIMKKQRRATATVPSSRKLMKELAPTANGHRTFASFFVPSMLLFFIMLCAYYNTRDYKEEKTNSEIKLGTYEPTDFSGMFIFLKLFANGSQFRKWSVLKPTLIICLCYLSLIYLWIAVLRTNEDLKAIQIESLSFLSSYMNGFLPFFFAFYVNNSFSRWWTLRTQGIGAVVGSFDMICVKLLTHCPDERSAHAATARYGRLVHALIFHLARREEGLDELAKNGLLEPSELECLRSSSGNKAQLALQWEFALLARLYKEGKLEWWVVKGCEEHLHEAKRGIQLIFTHLHCQLPFSWLHLMSVMVGISTMVLCFKASLGTAQVIGEGLDKHGFPCHLGWDTGLYCKSDIVELTSKVFCQFVQVVMLPFVYLGFMEFSNDLLNPFGCGSEDFPMEAYVENQDKHLRGILQVGRVSMSGGIPSLDDKTSD